MVQLQKIELFSRGKAPGAPALGKNVGHGTRLIMKWSLLIISGRKAPIEVANHAPVLPPQAP